MSWMVEIDAREKDIKDDMVRIKSQRDEWKGDWLYPMMWLFWWFENKKLKKDLRVHKPEIITVSIPKC